MKTKLNINKNSPKIANKEKAKLEIVKDQAYCKSEKTENEEKVITD